MTSDIKTIAAAGPSSRNCGKVDVVTRSPHPTKDHSSRGNYEISADYVCTRFMHTYSGDLPTMLYKCDCKCKKCNRTPEWSANWKYWDNYYKQFNPKAKPSLGTCAVFSVVERWKPKTIGLIGFDWILDGNTDWFHDAKKERQAILSLTNIVDLRNDNFIHRIRS